MRTNHLIIVKDKQLWQIRDSIFTFEFIKEIRMDSNFKDGIIRDRSSIGSGNVLGNIKGGIIRKGSGSVGSGSIVGNVKDGVIREGSSSNPGSGNVIGSVKNGDVYKGTGSSAGSGSKIGKVKDFSITGMEREKDEDMVAAYHFLVKKIF